MRALVLASLLTALVFTAACGPEAVCDLDRVFGARAELSEPISPPYSVNVTTSDRHVEPVRATDGDVELNELEPRQIDGDVITFSATCDGTTMTDSAGEYLGDCDSTRFGIPTTTEASVTVTRGERTATVSAPIVYAPYFGHGENCPSNGLIGVLTFDSAPLVD